jgi:hypothetical protein
MNLSAEIVPLEVSFRTLALDDPIDWHTQKHDELCLVLEGRPTIGRPSGKIDLPIDTLCLFEEGERHGIRNSRPAPARLCLLEFRVSPALRIHFRGLFERPPGERMLKLSADQRQQFIGACQKMAFESATPGFLNAFAASAWLTLLLVHLTRWLTITHPGFDFANGKGEIDPQCFELWQKIRRQVYQPDAIGRVTFGLDPCHDSLRHRFRKIFGISPQGLLIRLRMDRAKELLQTTNLSVKEIAHEIGYTRQHDLTRAFRKHTGASPSEWKTQANGFSHQKDWAVSVRSRSTAEPARSTVPFSATISENAKYFS